MFVSRHKQLNAEILLHLLSPKPTYFLGIKMLEFYGCFIYYEGGGGLSFFMNRVNQTPIHLYMAIHVCII